ncbi:hypothetical protein M419DRAFT_111181 [Trichoderma reesei RUT C-30]|uniref:Uncharacterized protein n=1 Tax=Hypocrea jecorina (strain ATCC 56765 / BCRC 32924 / NRRL 11460 / Rut C-30) TaxID=1344414 RepID=A0A024S8F9_HYPJR|nr:hypothetical protein M419DRAFT_111181 [Trichoderma reesei RUT C-30]
MMPRCPLADATASGVEPPTSFTSILAPLAIRAATMASRPSLAATRSGSGVRPTLSLECMSTSPRVSSSQTTSACPSPAA